MSRRTLAVAAVCGLLVACDKQPGEATHEITQSRPYTEEDASLVAVNSTPDRFGLRRPSPARSTGGQPSEGADNPFSWVSPSGWVQVEGSQMRAVNFKLGASGQGECYLVALPGGAGGVAANVNRWRTQMGQPELPPEEIAALPTMDFFGPGATRIDISGSFAGMGSTDAKEGYRMLGAIKATDQFTLFVKMTGPSELVAANLEAFDQFCGSVGIKDTPGSAQ